MDYAEACRLLLALPRFDLQGATAIKPGLDNIRALLRALGDPHRRYPTVHVAGTNGKGSVCSMLASILTASGRKVGLHTSPHLISLAERLRIDGRQADERWIAGAVSRMSGTIARVGPSFFEATTALAFLYFAEREADIAVIEVGMGGRLDATNVIEPELSIITNIGLDHTLQLGPTLALIAGEKAGIIKDGVPVVNGACQPEVRPVIAEAAAAHRSTLIEVCGAPWNVEFEGGSVLLTTPAGEFPAFRLDLPGAHQRSNALVATAAAWKLLPPGDLEQTVIRGLSNVRRLSGLRARCEIVRREPFVMVDVSHNEDGIRAALDCLDAEAPGRPPHVMLGLAADKDLAAILNVLAQGRCTVMPVSIPGDRGLSPALLGRAAREVGLRIEEIDSPEHGWQLFAEHAESRDRLLVAGSHYLIGKLPEELFPRRPLWSE